MTAFSYQDRDRPFPGRLKTQGDREDRWMVGSTEPRRVTTQVGMPPAHRACREPEVLFPSPAGAGLRAPRVSARAARSFVTPVVAAP